MFFQESFAVFSCFKASCYNSRTRSSLYKETNPFYARVQIFDTATSILSGVEAMHMIKRFTRTVCSKSERIHPLIV